MITKKRMVIYLFGAVVMGILLCGCRKDDRPKLNGVYLLDYKIVGEKEDYGTQLAIEELSAGVKELAGCELECQYGTKAGKKTIYIADSDSGAATYSIKARGSNIVISGPGITGRRQAVRELLGILKEKSRARVFKVEKPMFTLPNTAKKLAEGELAIGFIGDSVTTNVQAICTPWAQFFEKNIKEAYPDVKFKTYNCAIGGRTSSWGDENIELMLLNNGFSDLVFIAIGTNDKYYDVTEEQTRANYISMIEKIYKTNPDAEIVFMLAARMDELQAIEGVNGGVLSEFISVMVEVTDEYNIPLIDPMSLLYDTCVKDVGEDRAFSDGWNKYMSDTVHPLENGQKLYGGLVWKQIETALK